MATGDEEYDVYVLRHGRRHRTAEEYEGRRQVYQENKVKVQEWNARSDAHECAPPPISHSFCSQGTCLVHHAHGHFSALAAASWGLEFLYLKCTCSVSSNSQWQCCEVSG